MKRITTILLTIVLLLSAVSCGKTEPVDERPANGNVATVVPDVEEGTMGANMWNAFYDAMKNDSTQSTEDVAHTLIGDKDIFPYDGDVMQVEPGYLAGFDNYNVTGFEDGVVFMPIISVIPFVGYVFTLEEGTDAETFLASLEDHCNLRWNISTQAEQIVAGAYGNIVLFVMCPKSPSGSF